MRQIVHRLLASCLVVAALAATPAAASDVTTFSLPASLKHPDRIVAGPDGALWFTQYDFGHGAQRPAVLGRITTAGAVSAVSVSGGTEPTDLAVGPDEGLWYAGRRDGRGRLGRSTSAGVDEVVLPPGGGEFIDFATGLGGALWFADGDRVGRLAADRTLTFLPLPAPLNGADRIDAGHDGALWFTDSTNSRIGRITTDGRVRSWRVPGGLHFEDIATGPDGAAWFTSFSESRIGRITTDGRVRVYRLASNEEGPNAITGGADGAMWFTHTFGIGRILRGGEITELHLPEPHADPTISLEQDITSGPDGALWFTRQNRKLDLRRPLEVGAVSGQIGRIDVASLRHGLLVTRLTNEPLRGRPRASLRVRFTATRAAGGIVRLERGARVVTRRRIRAAVGANSITLRLPRRPGTYRLLVRLSLPSQSGSDSQPVRVTR